MVNIEDAPRLRELCEKASREYDHDKLLDLVRQINELLEKKRLPLGEEPEKKALPTEAPPVGGFWMNLPRASRLLPVSV